MKSQVENVSDVKKVIHFEIPWNDVNEHIKEIVHQISRSARIPGFRQGKAPESLIRSRFAQHIKEEVISHVVPEAYKEALKENQFDIISEPALHDVMYSEGSPFLFKVTIETRPSIELKNYKGFKLKGEEIEVKDEEIDSVLKSYQEGTAELIPQENTPAQSGHCINAHIKASVEKAGKSHTLFEDRTLIVLGSEGNHPAFEENLPGKQAGETVEFDATYPEDHEEKSIAGQTVHYQVKIESVNEKRISTLDDEFAKDLGDFNSLAELKEKIRKDILDLKTREQRNKYKDELLKQIVEQNPFEIPETMVKKELESLLHEYAAALQKRGMKLNDGAIDWNDIQARLSRQADQNVRVAFLVDAIALAEKITVTEDDVDRAVNQIADQQRRAPEAVKAELIKENKMETLKDRLRGSKTLDFLVDNAIIEKS